ncbi:protein spotted leaf 11-like [Canna indica]|uniref:U-box domain-containing protein 12 n=1 Tax=Canna indica TaxID=4628 RepID=A0AAQ3L413_9LILI|nr:protein spotted leaf 11-like [Canna indica]
MEEEKEAEVAARVVVERLAKAVEEVAAISDYRNAYKKHFCNLSRRVKLLGPMFEELRDSKEPIPEKAVRSLAALGRAIDLAKELLQFGSRGSKIYMVMERERIMARFWEVTAQLEQNLGEVSLDELDISDEVREQVELVHTQFKRAKERMDTSDVELYNEVQSIYSMSTETKVEHVILRRLAEKLQLMSMSDLRQESLALYELSGAHEKNPGEVIEKIFVVLKKIEEFMQNQNPKMCTITSAEDVTSSDGTKTPVVPDDFRCPISLELMRDPVIVSTGQTYERVFIEKWLEAGHETCPKTQQKLSSTLLTPNHVIRSLIAQWCEANGMEPPKRPSQPGISASVCSAQEHAKVVDLIRKLSSENSEDQGTAAAELRLLAKCNSENRVCIAEAGAIPLLVNLLRTVDLRTQEHAVTALLNLSIFEQNKGRIIAAGAVAGIIHVLKRGSAEARENSAATLFSLSVVDRNKILIGEAGAIAPLVLLLNEGSRRGKKDAAAALFNLCIFQGNKGKAVRAGVVPTLIGLLTHPEGAMADEALAILAMLSSHPEGKAAIEAADSLPVLVELIRNSSPRNKENAAAILVHLCNGEMQQQHLAVAQEQGVMGPLHEMAERGTDRGKRKAAQLLGRMNRFLEQQQEAQAQVEGKAHARAEALVQ